MQKILSRKNQFFERVELVPFHDCWEWSGHIENTGYGTMYLGSSHPRRISAHRASYIIHYGEIPRGMFVCHKCDNRSCVNPKHLFIGTIQDNNKDMLEKGRHKFPPVMKGEAHPNSKLTRKDVDEIKYAIFNKTISQIGLARKYGVDQKIIYGIRKGIFWK